MQISLSIYTLYKMYFFHEHKSTMISRSSFCTGEGVSPTIVGGRKSIPQIFYK